METIPPHMKSAMSNSQCHHKQQANCTTAQFNDHSDHSVNNTLPTNASNSVGVHHMPSDIAPTSVNKILNSIMSSSHSSTSNTCSINVNSGDCLIHSNGSSYMVIKEFQSKRGGLSLTLTDQGQTNNPKCNPYQLLNEILGFD